MVQYVRESSGKWPFIWDEACKICKLQRDIEPPYVKCEKNEMTLQRPDNIHDILLVSLKVKSVSLDLTGASHAIILDLW
jgi:SNF2 family DNA or RNA helicase